MLNKEVTAYIGQSPLQLQEIMTLIRDLLHKSIPELQEDFKWGRPVFRARKDIAYLKTAKNYITLGFFDYHKLDDKDGLLEGTGKDMRHLKLKSTGDIDKKLLTKWFKTLAG